MKKTLLLFWVLAGALFLSGQTVEVVCSPLMLDDRFFFCAMNKVTTDSKGQTTENTTRIIEYSLVNHEIISRFLDNRKNFDYWVLIKKSRIPRKLDMIPAVFTEGILKNPSNGKEITYPGDIENALKSLGLKALKQATVRLSSGYLFNAYGFFEISYYGLDGNTEYRYNILVPSNNDMVIPLDVELN